MGNGPKRSSNRHRFLISLNLLEPNTLGDRIRALRTARHRSVRGQAALAGIDHSTLLRWESGDSRPTRPALVDLVRALDLSEPEIEEFLACHFDSPIQLTGTAIKALRQKRSMTQGRLAELMSVRQSTVSKWEANQTIPTSDQQAQLRDLLAEPQDSPLVERFSELKHAIASYDLADCFDSYEEYWRTCATYPVAYGDHWGRELSHRAERLAETSIDAKRLLAWLYSSRAYGSLVRGNHRDTVHQASQAIRIGNEIGFDLTTSYSFWIAARTYFTKRSMTPRDRNALKRISMLAEKKLGGTASPFASLVRSSYLLSVGNLDSARATLSEIDAHRFGTMDEGQVGGYGSEYWHLVLLSYHQMFALQARAYDEVLTCPIYDSSNQPIPKLLSRAYNLAALTKVSKQPLEREYRELTGEADMLGLRFALRTMEDHVRRISNIDLASRCLS